MNATELLAAAEALQPLIREHAATGDRNRCIEPIVAQAMAQAGLYRMVVARSCGGYEAESATQVRVIEAVSRADGATGWTLMIGCETSGIASGMVSEEAKDVIFRSNPDVITAGALNPLGRGERVEGGYRVTGQWPFASGCHHASFFWGQFIVTVNGEIEYSAAGRPRTREGLYPRDQFTILDTWHTGGMRGSGSADVRVDDVFVPDHMVTDTAHPPPLEAGALFRMPLYSRLEYNKSGVSLGIAQHALDAFVELAARKTPRLSSVRLAEREQAQLAYADAVCTLQSARSWLFDTIRTMWDTVEARERVPLEDRARLQLATAHATEASVRAVELVHKMAGVNANIHESELERCLRDVVVVRQHITVGPAQFAPAARVLLGVPSGSPFLME